MNNTDFENRFQKSIIEKPLTPEGKNSDLLLGKRYSFDAPDDMLPMLLAGSRIVSPGPIYYHMRGLDCHIFIYTISGSARYSYSHKQLSLKQNSLLFINADSEFSIEQTSSNWDFYIGYIDGKTACTYNGFLRAHGGPVIQVTPLSPIPAYIDQLSCIPDIVDISSVFYTSRLITCILTEACLSVFDDSSENTNIPIYIKQMRTEMESGYKKEFTLEMFESEFKKSRYRLCHEFSKYYGISPIRFLNDVRIASARHLLTTTDMSVQEIGFEVGINDTNHLISLFKRANGVTPLVYRRQTGLPE